MELRRANSSVGRALRLHRRCRGFESLFAHHSELQQARGFNDHAPVFNSRLFSILTCSQFSPVLNSRLFTILACSPCHTLLCYGLCYRVDHFRAPVTSTVKASLLRFLRLRHFKYRLQRPDSVNSQFILGGILYGGIASSPGRNRHVYHSEDFDSGSHIPWDKFSLLSRDARRDLG